MKFEWEYNEEIKKLSLLTQIEINRNYQPKDYEKSILEYADINLLTDLQKAATEIINYLKRDKKIIIFGHDDPDGITATYILIDFLKKNGFKNISYYIPNREIEHYGIQQPLIDKILNEKIELLVTVDNGIASYDAVKKLNSENVKVIITDHHIIPKKLPPAFAVVNPKREDSKYPDKFLAGVGVAYLLLIKISEILNIPFSQNYLFWTALGTLADRVPLLKANRIILREAFKNWDKFYDTLFFMVDEKYQIYRFYSEKQSFMENLIPILHNGREKNGEHLSLKMLLSNEKEKKEIFDFLYSKKLEYEERRKKVDKFISKIPQNLGKYLIFIDTNNRIPFDFTGYFTSEIADKNLIPVLILKEKENDLWTCEARAAKGFNLIDAFKFASDVLIQFGGHAQAAGFLIHRKNIGKFAQLFKNYLKLKSYTKKKIEIKIDAVIDAEKENFIEILSENLDQLYPFGQDFFYPKILIKNFSLKLFSNKFILDKLPKLDYSKKYDMVFTLKQNSLIFVDYR